METFTVKFFAKLKEETQTEALDIALADVTQLADLKPFLTEQYPHWAPYLSARLLTAVNQSMVTENVTLNAGDEVALFPPVTGG